MAALRIEGAIDGLRNAQIQFIRDLLERRGFKDNKVVIEPVGKSGDNYVANVSRITTIVENGKDFKMVGKFAPENEALRLAMNVAQLFNNEITMYEEVLPKLVSLQIANNVQDKDLLRYAEPYGCLAEPPNEVILLEDLKESNFLMLDRFSCLSNDVVRLILKNFAILHSLSYALKKTEPETYDSMSTKLFDVWNDTGKPEEFKYYAAKLEEDTMGIIDDDKYKNALRGEISELPEICKVLKKTATHSSLVILQGDGWTNNFMFKLVDNTPLECIMIDYQISRKANPICDILNMVFNCTDHATRTKYYFHWMDYYYEQLDRSLSQYGLKANLVYPRDQLDVDLKRHSKMYLGLSVMLYSAICRTPEEAAVITDSLKEEDMEVAQSIGGLNSLSADSAKLFKARVKDLVDSYILFGYL